MKFSYEKFKVSVNFFVIVVTINGEELNQLVVINFFEHILFTANNVLFIINGYALKSCVPNHEHLRDILKFIDDEIRRVIERKPNSLFEPCPKTEFGVPAVLTFHP